MMAQSVNVFEINREKIFLSLALTRGKNVFHWLSCFLTRQAKSLLAQEKCEIIHISHEIFFFIIPLIMFWILWGIPLSPTRITLDFSVHLRHPQRQKFDDLYLWYQYSWMLYWGLPKLGLMDVQIHFQLSLKFFCLHLTAYYPTQHRRHVRKNSKVVYIFGFFIRQYYPLPVSTKHNVFINTSYNQFLVRTKYWNCRKTYDLSSWEKLVKWFN